MNNASASRALFHLKRLFEWYAVSGTEQNTRDERRAVYIFAIVALTASVSLWMAALFYSLYDPQATWAGNLACLFFGLSLFAPSIARKNRFAAEISMSFLACCFFSALTYFYGAGAGFDFNLLFGVLLLTLESGTKRVLRLVVSATPLLFLFVALPVWFPKPAPFLPVSPELVDLLYTANAAGCIAVTLLCVLSILRRAENAEVALDREYQRSEQLLANLLPTEIAQRLKQAPGEIIADEHPAVTILFADIVGFTSRAARMKPDALVGLLNRIFSAFDALTAKHGLEKIKTIGDAYMVAGGMPVARSDHAQTVASMALDMLSTVERISDEIGERIDIRIGLHTGTAVAGVIGSNKVFYDVWGETVNTASRLESHGERGRIQVSALTRSVLEQDFCFERRGVIDLKGMVPTEVYWMTGRPEA